MPLKLLAVGDVHLGRHPGGVPSVGRDPDLIGPEGPARALGPGAALERLVARAIAEHVDAVAFAGDVVEQEDDFFEAYRDLHRAVAALAAAGVRVVGVAGNHDVRVLPRLADELPNFHLLGRGASWEALPLRARDGTEVVLHGWSFARTTVSQSPLRGHRFARDGRPAIGLLHCDRDQADSRYAPVTTAELADAGLDAWLLGHIHQPDPLTVQAPSGYLGSVTALRRSELGARGPWLYTIGARGVLDVEHWALAPLRWELLTVDVSTCEDADAAVAAALHAARVTAARVTETGLAPDVLALRLRIEGRCDFRRALERQLQAMVHDFQLAPRLRAFVGDWQLDTLPHVDLATLAREPDPAGLLARRLQLLDAQPADPARMALLERARTQLARPLHDSAWQALGDPAPDDATLADWLRTGARRGLDALLSQRREAGA
jgi:DNA repair protein SbcD/Mre11